MYGTFYAFLKKADESAPGSTFNPDLGFSCFDCSLKLIASQDR